jgi:hypothetical protein
MRPNQSHMEYMPRCVPKSTQEIPNLNVTHVFIATYSKTKTVLLVTKIWLTISFCAKRRKYQGEACSAEFAVQHGSLGF